MHYLYVQVLPKRGLLDLQFQSSQTFAQATQQDIVKQEPSRSLECICSKILKNFSSIKISGVLTSHPSSQNDFSQIQILLIQQAVN